MSKAIFYIVSIGLICLIVFAIWPYWNKYWLKSDLKAAALYGTKHSIEDTRKFLSEKVKERGYDFDPQEVHIEKDGNNTVSMRLTYQDKISFFGDSTGLSVIMAVNGAPDIGDQEAGKNINNITIQDLHFCNVKVSMIGDGGYDKENHTIRRCIFMANDPAFDSIEQLQWQYITLSIVEHCIFLRQEECQAGPGIRTYKTKNCTIRGNVWVPLFPTDGSFTRRRPVDLSSPRPTAKHPANCPLSGNAPETTAAGGDRSEELMKECF